MTRGEPRPRRARLLGAVPESRVGHRRLFLKEPSLHIGGPSEPARVCRRATSSFAFAHRIPSIGTVWIHLLPVLLVKFAPSPAGGDCLRDSRIYPLRKKLVEHLFTNLDDVPTAILIGTH